MSRSFALTARVIVEHVAASSSRPFRSVAQRCISSSSYRLSAADQVAPAQSTVSSPTTQEEARRRAWYLEDEDVPASGPSARPSSESGGSSSSSPAATPPARQPRFVRYDPQSTTPDVSTETAVEPLPASAPAHFQSLHYLLTTSDLLEPSSVRFLYTPEAEPAPDADLVRVTRRWGPGIRKWASNEDASGAVATAAADAGAGAGARMRAMFGDVGATWDWVVVAQVKGRGKGIVARAERMIRLWLRENPVPELSTGKARIPRLDPDTDWSIIPVGREGADGGTCINLFTEEGLEKWGLASLWGSGAQDKRSSSSSPF